MDPHNPQPEQDELLVRALGQDPTALGELLTRHREPLLLMVRLRMDQRLQGRIDPADVLQETFLEAANRFEEYRSNPAMPFSLWLRYLTAQQLLIAHRRHLGVKARDADRELSLDGAWPEASSAVLAPHLVGHGTTPSQAAMRAETQAALQAALDAMDKIDREVLVLRHFEQLTNSETAQVLGLRESAASRRYARALLRLKEVLSRLPGEWEGSSR